MIAKEDPEVSNGELALLKVKTSPSHLHEFEFEQTVSSHSDHILIEPSRYRQEALKKAKENIKASTYYFPKPMFHATHIDSSLLDIYEIHRILKDLDHYIESSSSCDRYHRRKSIDVGSGQKNVSSSLKRGPSGIKQLKTIKETKWFGFRVIYKLCRSAEGGVVENCSMKIGYMNH
ncbi:hypothetical protein R6Q59_003297 [Mikania micrantha]|uniref:Uncharacterized protein n=1 Tax=Mikania micrantha TaxID=192012 RepID=A0A5N6MK68_9ASTR|nr:hypothetical protein E3N88_29776 [Mikania micrantha]